MSPEEGAGSRTAVAARGARVQPARRHGPVGLDLPASRLLVATDLTERSDLALQRGVQMACGLGADLRVLHVVEAGLPRRVVRRRLDEARSVIQEQMGLLTGRAPADHSISVRIGDPHLEIVREAIEHSSDVIIVGTHRRSSSNERGIVPTCARAMRYSTCPILFVRDVPASPYKHAVVEVNLTAISPHVIAAARQFAPEAESHLVHVYTGDDVDHPGAVPSIESRAARLKRVHALLDRLAATRTGSTGDGTRSSVTLAKGPVLEALSGAVAQRRADLLAVGLRPDDARDFSQALELNRQSPETRSCDVLVVPGPAASDLS
ncbi:MAG TPA: universal stress protein [Hyphomicrobiaceae bacterium]|nr:universal stress protein [Hyphomicrobiaceae bacterium]